jgi:hypothetical protein
VMRYAKTSLERVFAHAHRVKNGELQELNLTV